MDILELRIIFKRFVKQSFVRSSSVSPCPPTPALLPPPRHTQTHGGKEGPHSNKDRDVPNQTTGDIIILVLKANLVFEK